jgi:hypothetical protein
MVRYAALVLLTASVGAVAQSGETPVYVEQFQNLQSSMERVFLEVTKSESITNEGRFNVNERLFALKKIAHRLQEGAGDAGIAAQNSGRKMDKRLRLVEQGCMSIDSVLAALGNFLDTEDRFFLGLAVDLRQTVISIRKVL